MNTRLPVEVCGFSAREYACEKRIFGGWAYASKGEDEIVEESSFSNNGDAIFNGRVRFGT